MFKGMHQWPAAPPGACIAAVWVLVWHRHGAVVVAAWGCSDGWMAAVWVSGPLGPHGAVVMCDWSCIAGCVGCLAGRLM